MTKYTRSSIFGMTLFKSETVRRV